MKKPQSGRISAAAVTQMVNHAASGAAGVHADQNARRKAAGTGKTNRVGSRSAIRRAAIEQG